MSFSARYGTGRYNQSFYGNVYMPAVSPVEFTTDGFLTGRFNLSGQTEIQFTLDGFLNKGLSGTSDIIFLSSGRINQGLIGKTDFEFILSGLPNANRIKSYNEIKFAPTGHLVFTNTGPYYPTWNGKYFDLSSNTDPNIGHLDLLFTRTSGDTPPPFQKENT